MLSRNVINLDLIPYSIGHIKHIVFCKCHSDWSIFIKFGSRVSLNVRERYRQAWKLIEYRGLHQTPLVELSAGAIEVANSPICKSDYNSFPAGDLNSDWLCRQLDGVRSVGLKGDRVQSAVLSVANENSARRRDAAGDRIVELSAARAEHAVFFLHDARAVQLYQSTVSCVCDEEIPVWTDRHTARIVKFAFFLSSFPSLVEEILDATQKQFRMNLNLRKQKSC